MKKWVLISIIALAVIIIGVGIYKFKVLKVYNNNPQLWTKSLGETATYTVMAKVLSTQKDQDSIKVVLFPIDNGDSRPMKSISTDMDTKYYFSIKQQGTTSQEPAQFSDIGLGMTVIIKTNKQNIFLLDTVLASEIKIVK